MRRLILRWTALAVAVIALATLFYHLGQWQLRRLDERRATNDHVMVNTRADPVDAWQALSDGLAETEEWQKVTLTGQWDTEHQVVVRYRHLNGRQGHEVVTVLRTADGPIAVDRGFVRSDGGTDTSIPPPPTGRATVTGYLRRNHQGPQTARTPTDEGFVRLVDTESLASSWGMRLPEGWVSLERSDPPQPQVLQPLGMPDLGEGPHLSYALQWFAFALLAGAGVVVFIRSDLRDRRKARTTPSTPTE